MDDNDFDVFKQGTAYGRNYGLTTLSLIDSSPNRQDYPRKVHYMIKMTFA